MTVGNVFVTTPDLAIRVYCDDYLIDNQGLFFVPWQTTRLHKRRNAGMLHDQKSSQEARELMAEYGITHEQKTVYFYRGHTYDKLSDAVRYARDGLDRTPTTASASPDLVEGFSADGGYICR